MGFSLRVNSRNQVVLSKAVLKALGVGPDDEVSIEQSGDELRVRAKKVSTQPLGPEAKAAIAEGRSDIKEGRVAARLDSPDEVRDFFASVRRARRT